MKNSSPLRPVPLELGFLRGGLRGGVAEGRALAGGHGALLGAGGRRGVGGGRLGAPPFDLPLLHLLAARGPPPPPPQEKTALRDPLPQLQRP